MIARWRCVVAGLAIVSAAGCQLLPRRPESGAPAREAADRERSTAMEPTQVDPGLERAGFRNEVTPDQRINTHIDLARVLDAQGRGEEALAEYQKAAEAVAATRKFPGDATERARLHRRAGSALDRLGKFDEARAQYREAQRIAPRDADVWNDAGYSEYLQGRFDEAETSLRKARSLDPGNPRVLTNLGLVLAASGKSDEAIELMTRSAGPAGAHANLAYVLAGQGKLEEARDHYRSALRIDPELAQAREALTQVETRLRAALKVDR